VTGADFARSDLDGMILRMFMRGAGRSAQEVRRRPVIGLCNSWSELNPCNLGLRELADAAKRGVTAAGGFPLEFPTISLAEPYIKPTTLLLRNLMAMDVEEMIRRTPIDGVMLLGGCDKTIPAQLMGAVSAGIPAVTLAAGPRAAGCWKGRTLTIESLWTFDAQRRSGLLDDAEWLELEGRINPGIGTCNVMGTATSMAIVAEVLGMALPGSALLPATSSSRRAVAQATGERAVEVARAGLTPDHFVTPRSLENAFRVVAALGGSSNALIHLEALAGRIGHSIGLERFGELSDDTPLIGDVRPSGPQSLDDLEAQGGVPAVVQCLLSLLDGEAVAGDGRPWAEVVSTLERVDGLALRSLDAPVAPSGGIAVLHGSLAPQGAVIKRSAADPRLWNHTGPALVFDGVEEMGARIDDPALEVDVGSVLVLRGVGPVGGPGMPEVGQVPIPARLLRSGVTDMVRVSDARMSGTAKGAVVLHVAPESAVGGPLALVRDGDPIHLDVESGGLDLLVEPAELERRKRSLTSPPRPQRGYELLYRDHVMQAPDGCDFDFLRATGGRARSPEPAERSR
jgi:dihydroxy-acid dehydratase